MIPVRHTFSFLVADTTMRTRITLSLGMLGLVAHPPHASAATADPEVQELTRLVKMQAQQIHELQSRLSKVEKMRYISPLPPMARQQRIMPHWSPQNRPFVALLSIRRSLLRGHPPR